MTEENPLEGSENQENLEIKAEEFQPSAESPYSEKAQAEIYRLNRENAARRIKAKELQQQLDEINAQASKQEDARMVEEGKLKEVLDKREKELESLRSVKSENEAYKAHFEKMLEDKLSTIDQQKADLITKSNMTLKEKVEMASMLSQESKALEQSNSPDSTRPGGEVPSEPIDLDQYTGPQGRSNLIRLQVSNPKKYQQVLELKKQKDQ